MTALNLIPIDHFSGQRAITEERAGDDTRSLAELIRELQAAVNAGSISYAQHWQAAAASNTRGLMIAPADGEIVFAGAYPQTGAAAGESMTVDIRINGVTALTAVITLNNATGIDVVEGTLDPAAVLFSKGDKITAVRVYAPGGTPAPIANTYASIGVKLAE